MALSMNYEFNLVYSSDTMKHNPLFKQSFPELKETIDENLNIPNAYFKVDNVRGSKESLDFVLAVYKDRSKELKITEKRYSFTPYVYEGSDNFIRQAYEYLKTLPEFQEAIDV